MLTPSRPPVRQTLPQRINTTACPGQQRGCDTAAGELPHELPHDSQHCPAALSIRPCTATRPLTSHGYQGGGTTTRDCHYSPSKSCDAAVAEHPGTTLASPKLLPLLQSCCAGFSAPGCCGCLLSDAYSNSIIHTHKAGCCR